MRSVGIVGCPVALGFVAAVAEGAPASGVVAAGVCTVPRISTCWFTNC
jgi:hypothetical protein